MDNLQGNIYKVLKGDPAAKPTVTIQIYAIVWVQGYKAFTCRARLIFNMAPNRSTALWYEGLVSDLPAVVQSFQGTVELWVPKGCYAEMKGQLPVDFLPSQAGLQVVQHA